VQTWFNAVAEASGKTAYELEKEFAPSTVDRENFNKQRARLWEKYRLGKTMPTIKEKKGGRKGIAKLVDDKYPTTLQLLEHPLWNLLDKTYDFTMNDFKNHYEELDPVLALLFINQNSKGKFFWKNQEIDYRVRLEEVSKHASLDSITAIFIMMREALYCQNNQLFILIIDFIKTIKANNIPPCLDIHKLKKYIAKEFIA